MKQPKKSTRNRKPGTGKPQIGRSGAPQSHSSQKPGGDKSRDTGKSHAPQSDSPQSFWKSTGDIWPFVLGALLCGIGAYVLTWLASGYQKPNYLEGAASVLLLGAGACAIATSFGILHLGFNAKARTTWGIGAIAAGLLTVVAFFWGGAVLSPGFVFGLMLLALCLPGFGLGLRADEHRRLSHKPRFLSEWE